MTRIAPTGSQERSFMDSGPALAHRGPFGEAYRRPERNLAFDILVGALAGAAAVWMMDRVDWFNYRRGLDDERTRRQTRRARPRGMDPAHVIAAEATEAAGVAMSARQLDSLGLAVHYGIGIVPGALYGALRGRVNHIDAGRGSLFGLGLFIAQDEALNAITGLSSRPQDYPWTAHARGLIAHLVFGLVTDAMCRVADAARGASHEARPNAERPNRDARGGPTGRTPEPVRYHPQVEAIEPDEQETFDKIIAVMRKGGQITRERYGHAVRTSHAKAHGLVRGELRVLDGLAPDLRQGLFAAPRAYHVIVRLSHVPGELLDDRKVSTPRGMALKIFDVEGEMLPDHRGEVTQDWVLDTGKVFIAPGAKTFLAQITATEAATLIPQTAKRAVSTASLAANKALNAVGLDSANLDFYGHPRLHPLAEAYFSQCPMRYGDYIAKLGVFPDTRALRAMIGEELDLQNEDGLRQAVVAFFRENPAEYVIGIQLCTDLERMPVENANVEWPEDESPYRPVAQLILPPQDAYNESRRSFVDDALSFCPAHSLAAHRPLGSIMRARLKAYEVLGRERREANGRPTKEPRSIAEMSA